MKKLLLILTLLGQGVLFAQAPSGYYNSANGLTGDALKAELNNILCFRSIINNGSGVYVDISAVSPFAPCYGAGNLHLKIS